MFSTLSMLIKAVLFFLWSMPTVPAQMLVMTVTHGPASYVLPNLWQKMICMIFGIKVIIEGTPVRDQQVLFIANHISYLDIPVLGSALRATFISKNEVAGWPVFGTLARLQQTVFISRSRALAQREKLALSEIMTTGKSLILFPEGTSTDGRDVAPFKSSLFAMTLENAERTPLIQPITQYLESVNGHKLDPANPATQTHRDLYAWYGDMTMLPHLKGFARSRGAIVRLVFHPPIDPRSFENRKKLAQYCENIVRSGLKPVIATDIAA